VIERSGLLLASMRVVEAIPEGSSMAARRLTGRTLALATVALILACGKAVLGEPQRVIHAAGSSSSAGSPASAARGSNVATYTQAGGAGGRVVTYSASRGGSSSSVVTVHGERRRVPTQAGQRQPTAATRLAQASKSRGHGTSGSEPVVVVRHIVIGDDLMGVKAAKTPTKLAASDSPPAPRDYTSGDAKLRDALRTAPQPPALSKNAFSLTNAGVTMGQITPP
jgi:hypothetical protein